MRKVSLLIIVLALSFEACKKEKKETKVQEVEVVKPIVIVPKKVTMTLAAKSDSNVSGNVVFTEENGTVSMTAIISGLEAGEHAIHIHASSDCSSADGKSAGGHWNPTAQQHGKWGDDTGHHKGDIGNFTADENGNGRIHILLDPEVINKGSEKKDKKDKKDGDGADVPPPPASVTEDVDKDNN